MYYEERSYVRMEIILWLICEVSFCSFTHVAFRHIHREFDGESRVVIFYSFYFFILCYNRFIDEELAAYEQK